MFSSDYITRFAHKRHIAVNDWLKNNIRTGPKLPDHLSMTDSMIKSIPSINPVYSECEICGIMGEENEELEQCMECDKYYCEACCNMDCSVCYNCSSEEEHGVNKYSRCRICENPMRADGQAECWKCQRHSCDQPECYDRWTHFCAFCILKQ